MSRHSTIILALLAMALALIISFGEEVSKVGPRKSSKCEPALKSLRDMLPPDAVVETGDLSQSASQSPIAVLCNGVRIEAAGARSHRKGVIFETLYRMVGLTDERKEKWAPECESGYVSLERNGMNMLGKPSRDRCSSRMSLRRVRTPSRSPIKFNDDR